MNYAPRRGLRAAVAIGWLLIAGCTKTDEAWENAVKTDTPDAYASFLERHPRSEYAEQARTRRDALIDERDWNVARRQNTADGYAKYLSAHPDGVWSELARRRQKEAASIDAASAEPPSAEPPSEESPSAELPSATTSPAPAISLPVEAATAKRWVQLGAFSSASSAQKGWSRLERSFVELDGLTPVIDEPKRNSSLYRLRLQLDDDEEADRICAILIRGGAECLKLDEL